MLVQPLGYPAQEALRSGLSHSAPNTCTAISFETPRNGAANPCPGDICQHIPLTPTETFSLSLFLLFYYLRALPSLPCQPSWGWSSLSSSCFQPLSWLHCPCCSPAPHVLQHRYPKLEQRPLHCKAVQQDQLTFPAHSSLACAVRYNSAQERSFPVHLLSQLFQPPFPLLLFASILTEVHPVCFRLSLPICLRLNELHSFSPPAAQETARQMINATQALPGLGTRYTVRLDGVGRHTKSHQPRLSYAAACKSGLKRGQREAGRRTSTGNTAARAVALPWDFTQLQQLRNPFLPHRQTRPSCIPAQRRFALGAPVDCWCQSSPGMGLAQCWSPQDVCCCLLRHLHCEPTHPAVMQKLCFALPIRVQ